MCDILAVPSRSGLPVFVFRISTFDLFSASRGISQFQTCNLGQLRLQGAARADEERQRRPLLHLHRPGAEGGERVSELQDLPESGRAPPRQLPPQGVPRRAHQQTR